ncbi:MAG: hypothetical protein ABR568_23020, partial [Pyrinomonadaceae bacterium]
PHITVPAGYIFGLPFGISFFGGAYSEPKLIKYAYSFEQAKGETSSSVSANRELQGVNVGAGAFMERGHPARNERAARTDV